MPTPAGKAECMCPTLRTLSDFVLSMKPQQLDKGLESSKDAAVADSDSMREGPFKGRNEGGAVDSDVEEPPHEDGDRPVEFEAVSIVTQRVETEVPSTPPTSTQPPEAASAQKIEIEVVASVKRRLEFEEPSTPQQSLQPSMEGGVEAQQIQHSSSRVDAEDVNIANHLAPNGAMEEIRHDAGLASPHQPEVEPLYRPGVEPPEVITEANARQKRETSPHIIQVSEDLSDQPESQGLGFLADFKDADAGNGALYRSFDTDSEHFGKIMQDKSGWASRTRAVAIYLKEKFDAALTQDIDEQPRLSLGNTLKGRHRKEAARMFFEVLMLRTQDYIKVEQEDRLSDIYMQPTERLMKASL